MRSPTRSRRRPGPPVREVRSETIGLAVLEGLRHLDLVSYMRFASVYKGFDNVDDFERELVELQKSTAPKGRCSDQRGFSCGFWRETLAMTLL